MPTAAIRGRSFSPPFAKSSGKSTWKSSSVPIQQRALRSCPSDGSSSAPSPGSIAVAAWPRIGSASTERPWRSCALPQSASCSESSVKKQHDPGQTLRQGQSKETIDQRTLLMLPDKKVGKRRSKKLGNRLRGAQLVRSVKIDPTDAPWLRSALTFLDFSLKSIDRAERALSVCPKSS